MWYDNSGMDNGLLWGCGCSGGGSPSAYMVVPSLFEKEGVHTILQGVRKEAISWRMLFPGVANVVKVIWFRFRISVARELPLSTRPGFAPTLLACTISKSVTATSLLTSLLATGHFIRIAPVASKHGVQRVRSILALPHDVLAVIVCIRAKRGGKGQSVLSLLPFFVLSIVIS